MNWGINLSKIILFIFGCLFGRFAEGQTISVTAQKYNQDNGFFFTQNNKEGTPRYIADIQHFSIEHGLSHWHVHTVMQDSRGFIWIGTDYGLNRYDGHHFQVFTKEQNSLKGNKVRKILEDEEGWLWVFKVKQKYSRAHTDISFVNIHTLEVQTIEERFGENSILLSKKLFTAGSSPKKEIVLNTEAGELIRYSSENGFSLIETGLKKAFLLQHFLTEQTFLGLQENYGGKKNLNRYFKMDLTGKISWSETLYHFKSLPPRANEKLWFWRPSKEVVPAPIELLEWSENKEFKKHPSDSIISGEKFPTHFKGIIYQNQFNHTFWYKSNFSFWVAHPEQGLLFDFKSEHQQIIDNQIKEIFFDNRNNSWIATQNGVYKIQLKPSPFQKFLSLPEKGYKVSDAVSVRGILGHRDKLWVISEWGGWYQIDTSTGNAIRIPSGLLSDGSKRKVSSGTRSIAKLDDNHLLFGGNYLLKYNVNQKDFQSIGISKGKIANIWSIFQDRYQTYWLGLENKGLAYWKEDLGTLVEYTQYNSFEQLKHSYVYAFLDWDKEHILVGSTSGIYVLHHEKGIIRRFWETGENDDYFPHNSIYHFYRDKYDANVVWVATGGGGLVRWVRENGRRTNENIVDQNNRPFSSAFQQFTTANGLSSNVIYAVYEDENRNLWLPSDYGIIRLNKDGFAAKAYIEEDGLSHHEFNRISHFRAEDGTLYFGGLNGITAFHPNQIQDKIILNDAPLTIVSFLQFNGKQNLVADKTAELLQTNRINLKPGDKFFNLEFTLLDYQDNERVRYSYKMEGRDEGWIYLDENKLNHVTLPYGDYTLHVRGQSANGSFSKNQLEIPVLVELPVYLKTWFLLLLAATILALAVIFNKRRIRALKIRQKELENEVAKATNTIRQQNEELKNLDKVKSRFFANVSHELRTPLTLILGPINSILKSGKLNSRNQTFAELSRKSAKNLLRLVNEILDLTKMESGRMELEEEPGDFYSLLQVLVSAFDGMAQQKNIQYRFDYHTDKDLWLELDVKKFEKILNNLLSNAFKFTPPNGQITVLAKEKENRISLSVEDSGRGIHPDDLPHVFDRFYQSSRPDAQKEGGTGIGLSLCMEFAKLMQGNLTAESTLGKGSVFQFEFPKKVAQSISEAEQTKILAEADAGLFDEETAGGVSVSDNTEPSTILLVEDNENLREFIRLIVAEKYEVITAENGRIAWELLTANESHKTSNRLPNLIISDIMMPEMDGYQLLEKLKNSDRFRGIPVIMLTALAELKDKLKALRIGVDDYMVKPFDQEELMARVENLLSNYYSRSQWQKEYNPETLNKSSNPPTISVEDAQWLEEVEKILKRELSNTQYSVKSLAYDMAISDRQLERRLKRFIGLTPKKYFLEIQLQEAKRLFETKRYRTVSQVAYATGFKNPEHFSTVFRKHFGVPPSRFFTD